MVLARVRAATSLDMTAESIDSQIETGRSTHPAPPDPDAELLAQISDILELDLLRVSAPCTRASVEFPCSTGPVAKKERLGKKGLPATHLSHGGSASRGR